MSKTVQIEKLYEPRNVFFNPVAQADELGNFDGEISVDEMSAYIASLERRLAASTGYAKKSLDLQLTIARNALTNLRSQFERVWTDSPDDQRKALRQAIVIANDHARELGMPSDNNALFERARALGVSESRAHDLAQIARALLDGLEHTVELGSDAQRAIRALARDGEVGDRDRAAIADMTDTRGASNFRSATSPVTPLISKALAIDYAQRVAAQARARGTDGDSAKAARDVFYGGMDPTTSRAERLSRAVVPRLDTPQGNAIVRNLITPDYRDGPSVWTRGGDSVVGAHERADVATAIVLSASEAQLRALEAPTVAYLLAAMQGATIVQTRSFTEPETSAPAQRTYPSGVGPGVGKTYYDSMRWTLGELTPSWRWNQEAIARLIANAPRSMRFDRQRPDEPHTIVTYNGGELRFLGDED